MGPDDEQVPYRSPAVSSTPAERVTNADEDTHPTLLVVQKELTQALNELDSIHVFDLTEKKGLTVKQQIAAYKKAHEILLPLKARVDSVVEEIKLKYE